MNETYRPEEKLRIFQDVLQRMKEYTLSTITQICGCFDEETGELCGTGTFIEIRDSLYVLTAAHVAAEMFTESRPGIRKYPLGLCHSVGNSQQMANILNPWTAWSSPKDIAATRIESVVLEGTSVRPLNARHLALNTNDLNDDIYFIHGWPGERSRFTAFFERGVTSTSLPYGGWLESSSWGGFDENMHFAITFPPDELVDERGEPTSLPHPGGLSGSVVWKTNKAGPG